MTTKSRYELLNIIKQFEAKQQTKITTQQLASEMGLTRGVTSHYLSQLYAEQLVEKYGTKPVFWRVKQASDPFDYFIGSQGSLKPVIRECRAAVEYPPNGFPLIITGESGVGKSFLASLIYRYAKVKQVIATDAKLVALNCADYANNPELLSSVLFGFKKGAFTGAEKDTPGLVETADGGYLFLDEIHRLPKENQEKLFNLLDKGIFKPLGANEEQHVSLRFIFATTESLDDSLLLTFRRRVPMTITIPSYINRPQDERYQLIKLAFVTEAKRLEQPLLVSNQLIEKLVQTPMNGNLGTLNNQIKLLCAEAFTDQPAGPLTIGSGSDFTQITPLDHVSETDQLQDPAWFAKMVSELTKLTGSGDFSNGQFSLAKHLKQSNPALYGNLQLANYQAKLTQQLEQIWRKFGVKAYLPKTIIAKLSWLAVSVTKYSPAPAEIKWAQQIQQLYPRTFYLLLRLITPLAELTKDQQSVLAGSALYLLESTAIEQVESIEFICILASHGRSTATSTQEVVNALVGNFVFAAFDMPLEESMLHVSQDLQNYINELNQLDQPVILLFDMGSLSQMYKEIKQYLTTDLLVINNLSTPLALDIALQVQQHKSFKAIAERAGTYHELIHAQYYEGFSQNKNVIISCMSGVGLSEEIKKIMLENLQAEKEIITMEYKDLKTLLASHEQDYFETTDFIITTTDLPQEYEIPILNIYDIMEQAGTTRLKDLLLNAGEKEQAVDNLMEGLLKFFTIEGISSRLQFLNPKIVIVEVQTIVTKYQEFFGITLEAKIKLNLYMHIALMIERMLISSRNKAEQSVSLEQELPAEKEEFFSISKNIFHQVELKYNITIDDYELSLMYELLKRYIS